jgi:hypothetical protein
VFVTPETTENRTEKTLPLAVTRLGLALPAAVVVVPGDCPPPCGVISSSVVFQCLSKIPPWWPLTFHA